MNRMRENTKVMLMILVVAFMLTIIIDWGMGGFKSGGAHRGVIATVNGDDITLDQYNEQYQNELAAYREQYGTDPEGYQLNQLENRVFEGLVQQLLIKDALENLNLKTTDSELTEEIFNNPPDILKSNEAFQDSLTGQFDMARYQAALNNPSADQFWLEVERYLRSSLPMQKLANLLSETHVVTDADAQLEFMKTNSKVKVNYVFYNVALFNKAVAEPTEQEITAYYNAHKDDYKVVEKRLLDYVLLELKATPADSQSTIEQAQDILEQLKNGASFEELATLHSQDAGSAEKGGDLGYFNSTAMVKPFADAAFAAKKGEVVGPVATQFGLHIIKVYDKKKENGEDQVKASHILLKIEPSPATREALREEAEYIAEFGKENGLKTVVAAESLTVSQTAPFEKGAYIPGIGMETRVNNFAWRSDVGDISQVFNLEQGFLVAALAEVQPEHVKKLEDVKGEIVNAIKNDKSMENAREHAQKACDNIKAGMPFDQAAAQDSLSVQESDLFAMGGYVPKIGKEPEFVGTAFALKLGDFSQPVKGARGYYLLQVVDKQEMNMQEFESQKEDLKLQLAARYKQQIFGQWYEDVKKKADIKDYREMYF